jgi:peptide/nickel transport system ATP-binding protein
MLMLQGISVSFKEGEILAVDDVSLDIRRGEKAVIIGETGSGKSVLLLAVLKLLPQGAEVRGRVLFEGENLLDYEERQMVKVRGKRIGYIPQGGGGSLNPLLTAGFQIAEPLMSHKGMKKKEAMSRAVLLLRGFSVPEAERYSKAYPHQYSGGMRQRAMIAMGMVSEPEMLLIDEPTKGLDQGNIDTIIRSFLGLGRKTMLCVTHDLKVARSLADTVHVMYAAQVIESGLGRDFFDHPLHPYSQALLSSLPENGLRVLMGFAPEHSMYAEGGCRFLGRCPESSPRCALPPPLVEMEGRKVRCWLYA